MLEMLNKLFMFFSNILILLGESTGTYMCSGFLEELDTPEELKNLSKF